MAYTDLDPAARYKIRVVYAGDSTRPKIRPTTGDDIEIYPLLSRQATAQGKLHLKWRRDAGLGDAGRGSQVAEVSLMRR